MLRLAGWRVVLAQPVPSRCIVVFYPHTSNWDLPFMLATAYALGIPISWFGKHTLFGPGLGFRYYTAFGPIRVDIATPLVRRRGDSLAQLYISLGQAF